MKVKDAGFFTQHIEKLILGAGVLFLIVAVAVVGFGLIINPYQVTVGNQTYDDPADIIPELQEVSERLDNRLHSGDGRPEEFPEDYQPPDLETDFSQMVRQPVVQDFGFKPVSQDGLLETDLWIEEVKPPVYYLPTPPVVTDIRVKHGFEVLGLEDEELAEEFFDMWGQRWQEPADFQYVFVEGVFDLGEWIERLQDTRNHPDMVPLGIWTRKLGLASVYLIREELDPVTGEWGNQTTVSMLPDYVGVRPGVQMSPAMDIANSNIEWLLGRQERIAMPFPPPLADGDELLSPSDDPMMQFDAEELEAMEAEERAAERARRAAEREAERARRAAERDAERNNDRDGGGGLGGPGGRGGGRGGGGSGGGRGTDPGPGGALGEPGGGRDSRPNRGTDEPTGRPAPGRGTDNVTPGGRGTPGGLGGVEQEDELDPYQMRVWAIDVSVEPGKTYRYKLVAAVINPLYGVQRLEDSQLSENAERAALPPSQTDLDKMAWIDPIEVEPTTRFFVTSASERGARVNIWRVFNGKRYNHQFEVNPGDRIGGVATIEDEEHGEQEVDMAVSATVVDIDRRRDVSGNTVWTLIYIDEFGELHERALNTDQALSSQFERFVREEREFEQRMRDMIPENGATPDGRGGPGGLGAPGPGGFSDPADLGAPGGRGVPGRGGGR